MLFLHDQQTIYRSQLGIYIKLFHFISDNYLCNLKTSPVLIRAKKYSVKDHGQHVKWMPFLTSTNSTAATRVKMLGQIVDRFK